MEATMSSHNPLRRLTAPEIAARKGREKIVCLTAYTAPIAELLDPYVDLLLVGVALPFGCTSAVRSRRTNRR